MQTSYKQKWLLLWLVVLLMRAARRRVANGSGHPNMYCQWWADTNVEKRNYAQVNTFMYVYSDARHCRWFWWWFCRLVLMLMVADIGSENDDDDSDDSNFHWRCWWPTTHHQPVSEASGRSDVMRLILLEVAKIIIGCSMCNNVNK